MQNKKFDVVGIGYPLVDKVYQLSFDDFKNLNIKIGMEVDPIYFSKIRDYLAYKKIKYNIAPGGCISNSLTTIAKLNGKSAFIGSAAKDSDGFFFIDSLIKENITYLNSNILNDPQTYTGACLVLMAPNKEKSMIFNMAAGAHLDFTPDNQALILNSKILFMPMLQIQYNNKLKKYVELAKNNNIKLATTMQSILNFNDDEAFYMFSNFNIIIGNEFEIFLDNPVWKKHFKIFMQNPDNVLIKTMGDKGYLIFNNNQQIYVPVVPATIQETVSALGAGDAFAGGFLFGLAKNINIKHSAEIGAKTAKEVIKIPHARNVYPLHHIALEYL